MSEKHITQQIKAIREQAGMTMNEAAAALRYKTISGYQHYEDPTKFNQEYLPPKVAAKLIAAFVGRGNPPVTEEQILALTQPIGGPGSDQERLARVWWKLIPEDRRALIAMAESLNRERLRPVVPPLQQSQSQQQQDIENFAASRKFWTIFQTKTDKQQEAPANQWPRLRTAFVSHQKGKDAGGIAEIVRAFDALEYEQKLAIIVGITRYLDQVAKRVR
jgi:hypothetical protein